MYSFLLYGQWGKASNPGNALLLLFYCFVFSGFYTHLEDKHIFIG